MQLKHAKFAIICCCWHRRKQTTIVATVQCLVEVNEDYNWTQTQTNTHIQNGNKLSIKWGKQKEKKKEKGKKTHQETYLALIQINSFLLNRPTTAKLSSEKKREREGSLEHWSRNQQVLFFCLFCSVLFQQQQTVTVNTFHLRHKHSDKRGNECCCCINRCKSYQQTTNGCTQQWETVSVC